MALRMEGEAGLCGAGPLPRLAAALPHFGEEPPLVGPGGAGTLFFSGCNLRCAYCQNHQISRNRLGTEATPADLARTMLELQDRGCSTIEPVSPTHHLPGLLEALADAVENGLELPVVYNTNAYETSETLDLLEGVVDVYLPDLKYSSNTVALKYSDVSDYVRIARNAVLQMHSHVGNLVVDMNGTAVQGLVIRHLVLPHGISGPENTLAWIRANLPRTVTLSLMSQYVPLHRSGSFPEISRRITESEYDSVVDLAWELGFENCFVQDHSSQDVGVPDFRDQTPFKWE